MLPLSYRERYQTFLEILHQIQDQLHQQEVVPTQLQSLYSQLQQYFQQQLMPLTGDELSGELFSQWQSSQTEMHRHLRLLQTDLMFWQTSKSGDTSQQRLATVRDRVQTLIEFTTAFTVQETEGS